MHSRDHCYDISWAQNSDPLVFLGFSFYTQPKILHARRSQCLWQISSMVSCIVITILSLSRKKRILNEDAGTGEVPKGKIEEKKKYGANISILGKGKRIRGQFSCSRMKGENLTQKIKKSATFSNLEKRERPTISLSLPQSLSSQRRRK